MRTAASFMRLVLLLVLLTETSDVFAGDKNQVLLDSANRAYASKDYSKAVKLYEQIEGAGFEAAELYYNLGNAYFKTRNIPLAILNFERAKKMKPFDEDIDFNLKLANQQIVDKTENNPAPLISRWKMRFLSLFTEKTWAAFSILAFLLFLGMVVLFLVSSRPYLRQITLGFSFLFLITCIACLFFARTRFADSITHRDGIILAANITAKASPDENGTDLFILHEGTKISLLQNSGQWTEVRLSNGNSGWLPMSSFAPI